MKYIKSLLKASCVVSLFLMGCQFPGSVPEPTQSLKSIPTLSLKAAEKSKLSSSLQKKIRAKGGDPDSVSVVRKKDLKNTPLLPSRFKSHLNPPFAIQQLIPPVEDQQSCDGLTDICGYQEVGNWDEYNDAMHAVDFQDELCAFEQKNYCAYSESHDCNIEYSEMQFYGCDCPPGTKKSGDTCEAVPHWDITYYYSEESLLDQEVIYVEAISPIKSMLALRFFPVDGGSDAYTMQVKNSDGEIVDSMFGRDGYGWKAATTYKVLDEGRYTLSFESDGETFEKAMQFDYPESIASRVVIKESWIPTWVVFPDSNFVGVRELDQNETTVISLPFDERENLGFEVFMPFENNRLELINSLGQIVHYENLESVKSRYDQFDSSFMNNIHNKASEGNYTLRIVSGDMKQDYSLRFVDSSPPAEGTELYQEADTSNILLSLARRMPVLEQEVDWYMAKARVTAPDAPAFQIQKLVDPAPFRIQQQQTLTEDQAEVYIEPKAGELRKDVADSLNDDIVLRAQVLRQKIAWLKETQAADVGFTIQSEGDSDPLKKLENKLYGVTTSGGCFEYYKRKPKRRKEEEGKSGSVLIHNAIIRNDGGTTVTGVVINPPEGFDYNTLTLDFGGEAEAISEPQVTHKGNGLFQINLEDAQITQNFVDRIPAEGGGEPLKVRVMASGFSTSSQKNDVLPSEFISDEAQWPPLQVNLRDKLLYSKFYRVFGTSYNDPEAVLLSYSTAIEGANSRIEPLEFYKTDFSGNKQAMPSSFFRKNLYYENVLTVEDALTMGSRAASSIYNLAKGSEAHPSRTGDIYFGNGAFKNKKHLQGVIIHELHHRMDLVNGTIPMCKKDNEEKTTLVSEQSSILANLNNGRNTQEKKQSARDINAYKKASRAYRKQLGELEKEYRDKDGVSTPICKDLIENFSPSFNPKAQETCRTKVCPYVNYKDEQHYENDIQIYLQ